MGRWKPEARGRLEQAALSLYGERGFTQTTVAEIAERAGLTERTFFRHFADKRDVLFSGAVALQDLMVAALENTPRDSSAIDAVGAAVEAAAISLQERHAFARERQRIISAHSELQERERIKMASLASALADALRRRGVGDTAASLAAEMGIAVFRIAFERWIGETNKPNIRQIVKDSFNELKLVSSGSYQMSAQNSTK